MSFPEKRFGICTICNGDGGDYPASELTLADSQANIVTAGNGIELLLYQGRLMCKMCKDRLIADEQSLIAAQKHAEEQKFRDNAGFTRLVT